MELAVPPGTGGAARRRGPRTLAASIAVIALAATISTCGSPTPSAAIGAERCIDLQADAVGLAWSQTGQFLAVGTADHAGRVLTVDGDGVGLTVIESEMLPSTVVTSVDGHLVWISDTQDGRQLTESGPDGMEFTLLPESITGLGWTAIGYALLQHPAEGGSRVLLMDVDRPGEPTEIYRTELFVERLWITADPEYLLLTITHPDHRDAPATFVVAGPDAEVQLEPAGADTTGASMPALRRWVVYHAAATSRMEAIRVTDPGTIVTLTDRPAQRGMVSDRGILAYVPTEPAGQVCLLDVASKLP